MGYTRGRFLSKGPIAALTVSLAIGVCAHAQAPNPIDVPTLAREISPSVVRIVIRDQSGAELGGGSGFVVASDGKVVTNLHVLRVPGIAQAEVRFPDGSSYQAQGVGALDSERDLAILRLRAAVGKAFPALRFGDSGHVQVGQRVIAIGSPLAGLSAVSTETTVSDGIVSGIRDWPNGKMKVFQITAPLSPGSSGGVLLNADGEVVGVTFAQLREGQNLNFAIPSTYVIQLEASDSDGIRPLTLPDEGQQAPPKQTATPQEILLSAKTLCVLVSNGSPVLKSEISDKLLQWGKLTLVSSPAQAELVLEIAQTGQLNVGTGEGNQATATLRDRASGIELWSKTKGGSWAMSGWSNAWVGRALASEFTKFFDNALRTASKKASRGKS